MIFASLAVGSILEEVQKRGVSTGQPGFSATDEKGKWKGLNIDGWLNIVRYPVFMLIV